MPTCTFCDRETSGHGYRRFDGTRGFACREEPCHTIGARERQARLDLERTWRANARHRRWEAAHQLTLDLTED